MDRLQQLSYLNQALLAVLPQFSGEAAALPKDEATQRRLLRTLMNVCPPGLPLGEDFWAVQDAFLTAEREAQGHDEPTGQAKITPGYDLPAKYVLHTVGPIVQNTVTPQDRAALTSCYRSCLTLAAERSLQTVAFCCISTGEFHFPPDEAARIAVETVIDFLQTPSSIGSLVWGTTPPASSNTPSGG